MSSVPAPTPFQELARARLSRVVGAPRASELVERVLAEMKMERLETADDLFHFGKTLEGYGGIEAAVGALLSVQALIRGASGR